MTYTIQASKDGWILYRSAGVVQRFRRLSTVKMLVEDAGGSLLVLDEKGNTLN